MRKHALKIQALMTCAALIGYTHSASAQVPDAQLGTASPGRVEKDQLNIPQGATETLPNIEVKEMAIETAPPGSEDITFVLNDLTLEGVTAYKPSELQAIYKDKLGQTISLADVYGIAANLTKKYRNDGYILTQIVVPPQTIETGNVRLQVVEGYVSNVTVQGDTSRNDLDLIAAYSGHIKSQGGAINVKQLEHWMLLINELPGVSARGILSPSASQAGAADMVIVVERKHYDALLGLDNYGSRYLGPTQFTAAGSLNSVLGMNERITVQGVTTPMGGVNPELAYVGGEYEQPVGRWGTSLRGFASKIYTDPGYDLEQFDVKGQSELLGVGVQQPIIRSRAFNLFTRAVFDYRNVETTNDIEAKREDNIRTVRIGGRLEALESFVGVAHNMIDLEIARGIDVLGSSDSNDNLSRPEADPDFVKVNLEAQRLQRITPKVNVLVGIEGQIANNPLYSSEEFGVGGARIGRGYDPSEITGDEGLAGKVEIQWNEPYAIDYLDSYQIFGFYDIGKVWNDDATTSSQKVNSLASAGVGLRLDLPQDIAADATWAFPLTRDVQTYDGLDSRFLFSLSKRF